MKKLSSRLAGIISLIPTLLWLGYYSLTKNRKEKEFYTMFCLFIMNTIKTGKYEAPEAFAGKRIYP